MLKCAVEIKIFASYVTFLQKVIYYLQKHEVSRSICYFQFHYGISISNKSLAQLCNALEKVSFLIKGLLDHYTEMSNQNGCFSGLATARQLRDTYQWNLNSDIKYTKIYERKSFTFQLKISKLLQIMLLKIIPTFL